MTDDNNEEIKMRFCPDCKRTLPVTDFNKGGRTPDGYRRTCKDCTHAENKESRQLIRLDIMIHYSGNPPKCECCGETNLEFLTMDHINGDGAKHRKEDSGANHICTWIKRNKYPEGFRVLCMNCNFAHGKFGYCPHKTESKLIHELPENYEHRRFRNWSHKVTVDDVLEIRRRYEAGETKSSLAKEFGITVHGVDNIIARRRWKEV